MRELEALSAEELDTRCRRNGLSRRYTLLLLLHTDSPSRSPCCTAQRRKPMAVLLRASWRAKVTRCT